MAVASTTALASTSSSASTSCVLKLQQLAKMPSFLPYVRPHVCCFLFLLASIKTSILPVFISSFLVFIRSHILYIYTSRTPDQKFMCRLSALKAFVTCYLIKCNYEYNFCSNISSSAFLSSSKNALLLWYISRSLSTLGCYCYPPYISRTMAD